MDGVLGNENQKVGARFIASGRIAVQGTKKRGQAGMPLRSLKTFDYRGLRIKRRGESVFAQQAARRSL